MIDLENYAVVELNKSTRLALAITCPTCWAEPLQKCTYMHSYKTPGFFKGDIIDEDIHHNRLEAYNNMREEQAKS